MMGGFVPRYAIGPEETKRMSRAQQWQKQMNEAAQRSSSYVPPRPIMGRTYHETSSSPYDDPLVTIVGVALYSAAAPSYNDMTIAPSYSGSGGDSGGAGASGGWSDTGSSSSSDSGSSGGSSGGD